MFVCPCDNNAFPNGFSISHKTFQSFAAPILVNHRKTFAFLRSFEQRKK